MKPNLLWLACALTSGTALAARDGVIVGQAYVPTISVESTDGQSYNRVRGPTSALNFNLTGQCPSGYGVLGASARALHWPDSTGDADTSDLRGTDRKLTQHLVWVPHSLTPIDWHASWKQKVIAACNANLSRQKGNGRTSQQVFAQRWPLSQVEVDRVEGTLRCANLDTNGSGHGFDTEGGRSYTMLNSASVNVDCEKYLIDDIKARSKPKSPVDDITNGIHVVQANLTVLPKTTQNGVCGITLSGVIETDVINATVTLFYRNNKGGKTPWRTVKTDHSKTVFFTDYLDFSKPAGPAESAATPGRAPGGFAPNPGKQHSGYYQMVGKNIPFESNMASFNFDCARAAPGGVTTAPARPTTAPANPTVVPNKKAPPG